MFLYYFYIMKTQPRHWGCRVSLIRPIMLLINLVLKQNQYSVAVAVVVEGSERKTFIFCAKPRNIGTFHFFSPPLPRVQTLLAELITSNIGLPLDSGRAYWRNSIVCVALGHTSTASTCHKSCNIFQFPTHRHTHVTWVSMELVFFWSSWKSVEMSSWKTDS